MCAAGCWLQIQQQSPSLPLLLSLPLWAPLALALPQVLSGESPQNPPPEPGQPPPAQHQRWVPQLPRGWWQQLVQEAEERGAGGQEEGAGPASASWL